MYATVIHVGSPEKGDLSSLHQLEISNRTIDECVEAMQGRDPDAKIKKIGQKSLADITDVGEYVRSQITKKYGGTTESMGPDEAIILYLGEKGTESINRLMEQENFELLNNG